MERDTLAEKNIALSETVSEQKATVKKLKHQKCVDATAYRTAVIRTQEAHTIIITQLCEEFATEIEDKYSAADTRLTKNLPQRHPDEWRKGSIQQT